MSEEQRNCAYVLGVIKKVCANEPISADEDAAVRMHLRECAACVSLIRGILEKTSPADAKVE